MILPLIKPVEDLLDSIFDCLSSEISISIISGDCDSLEREQTDRQEVGVDDACDGNNNSNIFQNGRKMKKWRQLQISNKDTYYTHVRTMLLLVL